MLELCAAAAAASEGGAVPLAEAGEGCACSLLCCRPTVEKLPACELTLADGCCAMLLECAAMAAKLRCVSEELELAGAACGPLVSSASSPSAVLWAVDRRVDKARVELRGESGAEAGGKTAAWAPETSSSATNDQC